MRLLFLFAVVTSLAAFAQTPVPPPIRLTRQQAEELALRTHPRITAAQSHADALAQIPTQIRANNLPIITANVTGAGASDRSRIAAGGLNNPVIYDRFAAGINIGSVVTDFGRNRDLVHSAQSRADSERQFTEATRAQIILQVDRAYYALLRAQALLSVAQKTVDARQVLVNQVSALAKANIKSTLDLSFANVNLAEANLLLENERNEAQSAQADFAAALGSPGTEQYEAVDELDTPAPANDIAQMLQDAVAKRPELASLRLQETAAQQLASSENKLWRPTVSALTSFGVIPGHVSELNDHWAAAGVNVSIPIFNGSSFKARQTQADLEARASRDRLKDAELQVARDVRIAYLNALNAYQRLGLTAQLLDQSQLSLKLAQSRYDLGLGSIVELSQAQLNVTNAQLAQTSARYDYLARRADLAYQLGANR